MTDWQVSTTPTTPDGEHTAERKPADRRTALVEQLRSASTVRLRRRIGEVDPMIMERIGAIVRRLLEV
ncbi:type II toxin-antitoxin system PemK/MazF family toxin [Actinoallomurus spadix]|uniref:Type II toxin-antitoxin system PemK/MazF family toxin n=1 Tax=Actinoallomurus spadix TaxID=79912 RepID=A0ABN0W5Q1_9ACTN|nr:type II toxin-antitoxin system PemK/MazF family toxin [Actinoallomurus spadix]MCO5986155.1 type II toxin-antitoxin system PemK/MazF family toxin [Actinoallomurus spadix]